MCRVMRVSKSAYHAHQSGTTYVPSRTKAALAKQVEAVFYQHRRRYGSRRIGAELLAQGIGIGRFQVRSLMRRQSLRAIAAKCFRPQTTDSRHSSKVSPNLLLDAENVALKPGQVIVGDITYLPMRSGKWNYLATWQDTFSKRIVGWSLEERMTEELVIKAFKRAVASGSVQPATIIHTDRGSQYVSTNFRQLLKENRCRQSMSRRANCWDNAQAESLFSRYKAELLEDGLFEDTAQARSETFSYIEGYYNRVRRHSALDYKTPAEFEREWRIKTKKKESSSERVVSGKT
ncbi:MAG: IS3 family transposase [Pyrinomonadaceae bacterium MAG19_C2-C3]|nr:IS3 family transposase [Pyrinomonadaceae bacterium MAG19_C2-C3]